MQKPQRQRRVQRTKQNNSLGLLQCHDGLGFLYFVYSDLVVLALLGYELGLLGLLGDGLGLLGLL